MADGAHFAIPRIETARLRLREFRDDDLDAYAAICADAEVMRCIGDGATADRNGAWRQMATFNGHWTLRGCGMWAVERRCDGAMLGRIGLHHPPYWPALEAGWVLARGAWGQGYAREGARAAVAFARDTLRAARLISLIRPGNEASVRVAQALGAVFEGEHDLLGSVALVYGHDVASHAD